MISGADKMQKSYCVEMLFNKKEKQIVWRWLTKKLRGNPEPVHPPM